MQTSLRKNGCTLVELLVAVVVFTLGALSLAGTSAVVLKRLSLAHVRVSSAEFVSSRLARLASTRCGALSPGTAQLAPGLTESWSAEPAGPVHARARVTLHYEPRALTEIVQTTITCR